jgi:hypothetical protein
LALGRISRALVDGDCTEEVAFADMPFRIVRRQMPARDGACPTLR